MATVMCLAVRRMTTCAGRRASKTNTTDARHRRRANTTKAGSRTAGMGKVLRLDRTDSRHLARTDRGRPLKATGAAVLHLRVQAVLEATLVVDIRVVDTALADLDHMVSRLDLMDNLHPMDGVVVVAMDTTNTEHRLRADMMLRSTRAVS